MPIGYNASMRWWCIILLLVVGCTSAWERHTQRLAEEEAHGKYAQAAAEARWLVDNAFYHAPDTEQTPAAEAARYLRLADLAARAGHARMAIEALREALVRDPHQGAKVRAQLDRLPLDAAALARLKREFAWNIAALDPGDAAQPQTETDQARCWSYRVREVRIRQRRTVRTPEGLQRELTYDARPWLFDAAAQRWHVDGGWVDDVGTEVELVKGPSRPRYQALLDADQHFYADDAVPPCHLPGWQGPYDPAGSVFVATRLPMTTTH